MISIIIPTYNEDKSLVLLLNKLIKIFKKEKFEIIICDDNSKNKIFDKIKKLYQSNNKIKGIKLSSNIGPHNCVSQVINLCKYKFCSVIASDGQEDPEDLYNMFLIIKNLKNKQVIFSKRTGYSRHMISKFYIYFIFLFINFFSKEKISSEVGFMCVFKKQIFPKNLYFKKIFLTLVLMRNKQKAIFYEFKLHNRKSGKSKFNTLKKIKLLLDIIRTKIEIFGDKRKIKLVNSFNIK